MSLSLTKLCWHGQHLLESISFPFVCYPDTTSKGSLKVVMGQPMSYASYHVGLRAVPADDTQGILTDVTNE